MGTFEVVRTVRADRDRVFAVVADFRSHGDYIPLTRITADAGPIGPGWRFVGRTGVARLRLVDRMEVTRWEPGLGFRIDKRGPVLEGWAELHLSDDGPDTRLVWRERIVVRPASVGRLLGPLLDPGNKAVFGVAVDRMVARAEQV